MKRKTLRKKRVNNKMKGTLATTRQQLNCFKQQLEVFGDQVSIASRFQNLLESSEPPPSAAPPPPSAIDEKDFILSQDFFCTPDYITPDAQVVFNDCNQENSTCPKSPEKLNTHRSKRYRQDFAPNSFGSPMSENQYIIEIAKDTMDLHLDEGKNEQITASVLPKNKNYVSQSAVALRCRVMPPPCLNNPYLKDASEMDKDPFGNRRSKCAGFFPALAGGDGLSRYFTDFHEIKQIGTGNFSRVFKVLKRIDGCVYAVKQSARSLHQETERSKALMEVQALAALGSHENIVGYYSSWFESEQLYIQMELCEHSLSMANFSQPFTEVEVLEAMHQIAKALQFIHERGIAHLDLKLDNIYVKNGVYKLGDFGCATLLDKSLPIEEGDARYMPQEILNDNYDHLDKVDIFSLGIAMYELIRGSHLPESGPQFTNLREGKLPLLPGHSLQFQHLLKVMVDSDPGRRPSARDLVRNPIFERVQRNKIK